MHTTDQADIVEAGCYINPADNNPRGGSGGGAEWQPIVLTSDRDFGLSILRYADAIPYAAPGVTQEGPAAGRAPPGLGRAVGCSRPTSELPGRDRCTYGQACPHGGPCGTSAEGRRCRPMPNPRASAAAHGRRSRSRLGAPLWDPAHAEACARLFAAFIIAAASPRPPPSSSNGVFAIARRRRRERAVAAARAE
jgi:hypothetical protein